MYDEDQIFEEDNDLVLMGYYDEEEDYNEEDDENDS